MKSNLLAWVALVGLGLVGAVSPGCGSSSDSADGSTGTSVGATGSSGTDSSAGSGGCIEAWSCTAWETSGTDDQATRSCTDGNACGTTEDKPLEAATLPALDENFYRCNVEPVLDRKCSQMGCHGTEEGRALRLYARGRLRHAGEPLTAPAGCAVPVTTDECIGSLLCKCRGPKTTTERRKNYDSARAFGLDSTGSPIAVGSEDTSELISQPVVGGKAHAGIHLFRTDDADYNAIKDWLGGATLATCNSVN